MTGFKKAKSHNWIEADNAFGDFDALEDSGTASKRKRINNNTLKSASKTRNSSASSLQDGSNLTSSPPKEQLSQDDLWIIRHEPSSMADLAVNVKKVEEVKVWLETRGGRGGVLLLTGPAGCGKTACLRVLTKQLDIQVEEWINPVEQVDYGDSGKGLMEEEGTRWIPGDTVGYSGKAGQFKDWLRGAKYSNLSSSSSSGCQKLVLLEDLPSSAVSRNEEFLNSLQTFSGGRCHVPLVVILSDAATQRGKGAVLPQDWLDRMQVKTIAFNPVTVTNLVKTLSRIALHESQRGVRKFRLPEKTALENLAESVGGDIRGAINALQFSCLNEMSDLKGAFESVNKLASSKPTKAASAATARQDKASSSSLSRIGGKDQSLFMFHALGKVLYAKRQEQQESYLLPHHLRKHSRRQLKCNPEEVLEKTSLPADPFTCFLHHNYPAFYSGIEEVRRLSEYFSEADLFLKEWGTTGKISLTEYGGSVAARAVMFCNPNGPAGGGMRKLTKPEYYSANRIERLRQSALAGAFPSQATKELVTCSLPLLARLRPAMDPSRMATVTEISSFPLKSFHRTVTAAIDQDDIFNEEEEAEDELLARACEEEVETVDAADEGDEIVIEDFDDE